MSVGVTTNISELVDMKTEIPPEIIPPPDYLDVTRLFQFGG